MAAADYKLKSAVCVYLLSNYNCQSVSTAAAVAIAAVVAITAISRTFAAAAARQSYAMASMCRRTGE